MYFSQHSISMSLLCLAFPRSKPWLHASNTVKELKIVMSNDKVFIDHCAVHIQLKVCTCLMITKTLEYITGRVKKLV